SPAGQGRNKQSRGGGRRCHVVQTTSMSVWSPTPTTGDSTSIWSPDDRSAPHRVPRRHEIVRVASFAMAAEPENRQLDLRDYLQVFRRRKGVIILTALVAVAAALILSYAETRVYQATAEVL